MVPHGQTSSGGCVRDGDGDIAGDVGDRVVLIVSSRAYSGVGAARGHCDMTLAEAEAELGATLTDVPGAGLALTSGVGEYVVVVAFNASGRCGPGHRRYRREQGGRRPVRGRQRLLPQQQALYGGQLHRLRRDSGPDHLPGVPAPVRDPYGRAERRQPLL